MHDCCRHLNPRGNGCGRLTNNDNLKHRATPPPPNATFHPIHLPNPLNRQKTQHVN